MLLILTPFKNILTLLLTDGVWVKVNEVWELDAVNSLAISLTVAAAVEEIHAVPLEVSTLPLVPGATDWIALIPFPNKTLLEVKLVEPVPPLATEIVVPLQVPEAIVPKVVRELDPAKGDAPIVL